MRHVWTVLCLRTVVDEKSKNVSLIDVLEQVNVPESEMVGADLTFLPLEFRIATLWERSGTPSLRRARTTLVDPSGTSLMSSIETHVDLTTNERARVITSVPGIPLSRLGRYVFRVEVADGADWTPVGDTPLTVAAMTSAPSTER